MDSRARRNLTQLNTELQDVQKIMVQNIDDVLQRGLAISGTTTTLMQFTKSLIDLNRNFALQQIWTTRLRACR